MSNRNSISWKKNYDDESAPSAARYPTRETSMEVKPKIARRGFFTGLGLVAAAGVAAKLAPQATPAVDTATPAGPQGASYRLTEHIKKYYRTTTI
jgi:hypothetical protein